MCGAPLIRFFRPLQTFDDFRGQSYGAEQPNDTTVAASTSSAVSGFISALNPVELNTQTGTFEGARVETGLRRPRRLFLLRPSVGPPCRQKTSLCFDLVPGVLVSPHYGPHAATDSHTHRYFFCPGGGAQLPTDRSVWSQDCSGGLRGSRPRPGVRAGSQRGQGQGRGVL